MLGFGWRFNNQRLFQRLPARHLVQVSGQNGTCVAELTNLRDFSETGVAFFFNGELHEQESIKLSLNMNIRNAVRVIPASARVVRIRRTPRRGPYLVAAAFTQIDDEDRAYIHKLVQHSQKRPKGK